MSAFDEGGRPDFAGFVEALREEARWVEELHGSDRTGQAASDAAKLHLLAAYVAAVGRRLGYMAEPGVLHRCRPAPDYQYTEDSEVAFYREPIRPEAPREGLHCSLCGAPGTTHRDDCLALATGLL